MKFSLDKGTFLKALSHGQSVVERKTTIPILSHVLLQATPAGLKLTTTDMDLALVETIAAEVENVGETTVSAHMLFDIVRKLPEKNPVELELKEETGQLHIKSGKSNFKLSYLPAADFPQLTKDELPIQFSLTNSTLKRLIDQAKFAMSTEDTRYYLNGIYFHVKQSEKGHVLRSVATDAHRLALIEVPMPDGASEMTGIIVGRKTVNEIRKLLDESDEEVTLRLSTSRIEFSLPNAVLSSRLIDGAYPDYEQAIPNHCNKTLIINAKAFSEAVDRVATIAIDKVRIVKMSVTENTLTLNAVNQDLGSASEEIAVDFPHQENVEIGFNARYLLDIAQHISDEEAQIHLADSASPAIIQGTNDSYSLYVLMPMRV